MKMNKFFMLGLAGLAFAACNNDDEVVNGNIEGTGMVEVTIQSPSTKSLQSATSGSSVIVGGNITVEVYSGGSLQGSTIIERNQSDEDDKSTYTVQIFNVTNPDKVVAYCNDGKSINDDADISITDSRLQAEPQSIPAYAEAGLSTADIKGEMENEKDGKVYQRYTKSLKLEIPVARIELSGLKHVDEDETCKFASLFINGVYLNNIYAKKNDETASSSYSWNVNSTEESENFPILYDVIGNFGVGESFLKTDDLEPVFPGNNQAYAYNFFAGEGKTLPELKIYFNAATASSEDNPVTAPRYAIVKSYKNSDGPITEFLPGVIYRITNAELDDKYIGPNENGDTVYGVEVTVEEARWSVTDIEAEWVEQ